MSTPFIHTLRIHSFFHVYIHTRAWSDLLWIAFKKPTHIYWGGESLGGGMLLGAQSRLQVRRLRARSAGQRLRAQGGSACRRLPFRLSRPELGSVPECVFNEHAEDYA